MDDKTEAELYYSINRDEPDTLDRLLRSGVDPNTIFDGFDALGKSLFWSALHFCCEKGRLECARLLLAAGANPDVGDRWCMTPLMYAIRTEWHNMVELMLNSGATVDLQDTKGRTPLHLAAECSDDVCVKILCEAGADVDITDLVGRNPVWTAVSHDGRVSHVTRLLGAHCDVTVPDKRDKRLALQQAIVYAEKDRVEYVRLLLEAGSDVNHRDEANLNSMLNLLYKWRRVGREVSDDDMTIAVMLLDSGYRLNDVPYRQSWHKFGGTAIKMAADFGATELVDLFLKRGANPDLPDDCGVTPLLAAAYQGRLKCAALLLRANCCLDTVGELKVDRVYRSVSPLRCAIARGHFDVVRLLVGAGASPRTEQFLYDGGFDSVPSALLEDCDLWGWLVGHVSNPLTLFDICVHRTRRCIGLGIGVKLDQLPLPGFIKRCLLLDDLFSQYI